MPITEYEADRFLEPSVKIQDSLFIFSDSLASEGQIVPECRIFLL